MPANVTLEPWGRGDLALLERLLGDPHMTEHLGGPESPEKLRERQEKYERAEDGDRMFRIVDAESGEGVGSVGFWTKEWRGGQVYEVGWMVVPEFQGRGIAAEATAQLIELARRDGKYRFVHAFPNVDNAPSNAICRKLGFELLEACEFEYPEGHWMTCNDWRLDLGAPGRRSHRHTDVGCLLADGERCTVEIERHRSVCVPGQQSVSAPVIGYGTPPSTGGTG